MVAEYPIGDEPEQQVSRRQQGHPVDQQVQEHRLRLDQIGVQVSPCHQIGNTQSIAEQHIGDPVAGGAYRPHHHHII
ncbi:hypothetical protein D3C75_1068230 [compost metagenome]